MLTAAVCAQLNIAYPVNGTQKKVEIDDDGKLCEPAALMFPPALRDALAAPLTVVTVRRRAFFDKRLSQEVEGDSLGEVRPRARASEQQRSTLLMLAFTACSGGRRACTAAGLQRLQARLPAPRGPLTGGVRRAAGVQGLRVQDPGRPGQAGLPDEAGRAGAGPGAGPDADQGYASSRPAHSCTAACIVPQAAAPCPGVPPTAARPRHGVRSGKPGMRTGSPQHCALKVLDQPVLDRLVH